MRVLVPTRVSGWVAIGVRQRKESIPMKYICKQCGAESPTGIGYAANDQTEFPEPDPTCPNPHVDPYDALNQAARFTPAVRSSDLPYVEIGGVRVSVFFNEFGVLVISTSSEFANPSVVDAKGRVCVQYRGAIG